MNVLRIVKDEPVGVQGYLVVDAKRCRDYVFIYKQYVSKYKEYVLFGLLILIWYLMPLLDWEDRALVTDGLWQLVLMTALCFLGMLGLCWWLLKRFWMLMGLPELRLMVLRFNGLALWGQLGFYFLCYALLLLVAVSCMVAVL
jgi:hypothetical protein